jgi:hypothetical protein
MLVPDKHDRSRPIERERNHGRPPMPEMLVRLTRLDGVRRIDPVRRIAYELGSGRAIDNTRREIDATNLALARVEALARRVPPTAGESSPEVRRSA